MIGELTIIKKSGGVDDPSSVYSISPSNERNLNENLLTVLMYFMLAEENLLIFSSLERFVEIEGKTIKFRL